MTIATLTMNPALDVSTSTERVRPTDKLRCTRPTFDPGGGGINVARVIRTLGGEATAVFPSGGPPGTMVEQLLAQEGVTFDAVRIAEGTRESLTVDEEESGDQYRFVLPGPGISEAERAQCLQRLMSIAPAPRLVVASGSLPPGAPPDFYVQVAASCESLGARFILDTSGEALRHAVKGQIYLLKPSLREVEDLLGRNIRGDQEEMDAARELAASGAAEAVVLSLGSRGAVLADRTGARRLQAARVESRSAVGAGDSMVAGIVFGLDRGLSLEAAVRFGMASGTAAMLTPATELVRLADVERLYGRALPSNGGDTRHG